MVESQTMFKAKVRWGQLTTANSNLDGLTGAYVNVVTGGGNGTLIKTIIIKGTVSTTQDGMIRLFIKSGSNVTLIMEIPIPIVTKSARDCAYYNVLPLNYALQANELLIASTENSNSFNVIAECLDWSYAGPAPDFDNIQYLANTSGNKISVANLNFMELEPSSKYSLQMVLRPALQDAK